MAIRSTPPPFYSPFAVAKDPHQASKVPELIAGFDWLQYFGNLADAVDAAPSRVVSTKLTAQAASLGVTPLKILTVSPGIYRVSYVFRITRAATVSSSLTFTWSWTHGGAQSWSGAAEAGNTTTTKQDGSKIIRVDANTPISYSVVYASVGATPMLYELDLIAESLALDSV